MDPSYEDPWLPPLLRMDMFLGPPQLVATLHLREFRETGDESITLRDICEGGRLGKHHIPRESKDSASKRGRTFSPGEKKKKKKK